VPGTSNTSPTWLTALNSGVVYAATDASHGSELWFSDGTAGGTNMIRDINTGAADSDSHDPSRAGGFVYFSATDATHGDELWRTDGTHSGTTLYADINPTGSSDPHYETAIGSQIFLAADDGTHGTELMVFTP
jgi:ELWxxDGT repeat protein